MVRRESKMEVLQELLAETSSISSIKIKTKAPKRQNLDL
jgi:hypothetical protein